MLVVNSISKISKVCLLIVLLFQFSVANPNELQRKLETLWDSGFPAARVSGDTIDRGSAWVWSYALQLKKGKTDADVFADLSQIQAGSPVVLSQVPRAERSLLRLGYFVKNSEAKLYRIENRNRLVPVFDLADATANFAEASVAYDAATGENNLYLMVQLLNMAGTARDFSLSGENSENYSSVEMSYKEPFIFGPKTSLKLFVFFSEEDTVKQHNINLAYIHKLGWEWQYSVGGGYKNNEVFYSLSLSYDNRDKMPLPFNGLFVEGVTEISKFIALGLRGENYQPFSENWTLLYSAQGHGMLPSNGNYEKQDLFSVGGQRDFKSMQPRSLRTRAYGTGEMDFQWHGLRQSALHIFGQLGAYRNERPFSGWERVLAGGLGWEQGISNFSLAIFYAVQYDMHPMDGLLNLSVKMGF